MGEHPCLLLVCWVRYLLPELPRLLYAVRWLWVRQDQQLRVVPKLWKEVHIDRCIWSCIHDTQYCHTIWYTNKTPDWTRWYSSRIRFSILDTNGLLVGDQSDVNLLRAPTRTRGYAVTYHVMSV